MGRLRPAGALLLGVAALAGCKPGREAPAAPPHAEIGAPYRAGGVWRYPRASLTYRRRGLAGVYPAGRVGLTADGEVFSRAAIAAAHPTLQLPAIARVTNLANGRQLVLRINDRGPADPGRILEVTAKVAGILGFGPEGVAEVRVTLLSGPTIALAAALGGKGSGLAVAAAPVGVVTVAALNPPPAPAAATAPPAPGAAVPDGEAVGTRSQVPPGPGRLFVQAGAFGEVVDADRLAARYVGLSPRVVAIRGEGRQLYAIRIGPFDRPGDAEAILHRAIAAGLTEARIVIE